MAADRGMDRSWGRREPSGMLSNRLLPSSWEGQSAKSNRTDKNTNLQWYLQVFSHKEIKCLQMTHLSSVQFSSVAQSCPTLCHPMNHRKPGLPVHHHLSEFTQTHVHESVMPSSHLILGQSGKKKHLLNT